ncbi:hypothetical protein [Helicobacter sp.]|uniref:hypothetical protein n=1 Tax=Helicobacter sp. TaxID=218 RepID=UPI0019AFE90B|nr:hypothetical protein [Helicobacter sp.]MBD5165146.1 hypothetical protein [Helicobacter sp.]
MIPISVFRANFDELNIKNLAKRALLDSLKIFYQDNEYEYMNFLESIGINYYEEFNNIFELNNAINKEIRILNDIATKQNLDKFDFRAVNLFKRNLKEINDSEYYKLNLDLRHLNDNSALSVIKDTFILTNGVSLVEFKDIEEERVSLIYHKKGAMFYDDELLLHNARAEKVQLLENFKEPKDNNFILTRFLVDFSRKLKESGIKESFCYTYEVSGSTKEVIKDIDEILYWGSLTKEEKETKKESLKKEQELNNKAVELAKGEIKEERDSLRASLKKESKNEALEEKTLPRLNNLKSIRLENQDSQNIEQSESKIKNSEKEIQQIISDSFELYIQKEIEKTNIRLEKAKKDSFNAYEDLKANLRDGLSILEAIKNIQQKYRNEDTINFATLLFSKEILNVKSKEEEIESLTSELKSSYNLQEKLNDEITKREETISKLKGTMQNKINEMTALRFEFEEKMKEVVETEIKLKELEKYSNEQEATISELDNENQELSNKNKELNNEKIKLESQNEYLKTREQGFMEQLNELKKEVKDKFKKELELEKVITENKYLQEAITESKQKILSLENKIENIFTQALRKELAKNTNEEKSKKLRSRDILGD